MFRDIHDFRNKKRIDPKKGMLKNSGTQEKKRKAQITGSIIVVIRSFLGKKINIIDFL